MKNFLKKAGKETVIGIGMLILIVVIVVVQSAASLEWPMIAVVGAIVIGLRWLSVHEVLKIEELRHQGIQNSVNLLKEKLEIERRELENKKAKVETAMAENKLKTQEADIKKASEY